MKNLQICRNFSYEVVDYTESGKFINPWSQMVPLNLLPTLGSPNISIILIATSNVNSLQQIFNKKFPLP